MEHCNHRNERCCPNLVSWSHCRAAVPTGSVCAYMNVHLNIYGILRAYLWKKMMRRAKGETERNSLIDSSDWFNFPPLLYFYEYHFYRLLFNFHAPDSITRPCVISSQGMKYAMCWMISGLQTTAFGFRLSGGMAGPDYFLQLLCFHLNNAFSSCHAFSHIYSVDLSTFYFIHWPCLCGLVPRDCSS